jgi:hypothetical protein
VCLPVALDLVRPEGHRLGVKRRQGDPPRHDSGSWL